jgi:putative NIF3 family GTP cyclohydrolase 1 type 2
MFAQDSDSWGWLPRVMRVMLALDQSQYVCDSATTKTYALNSGRLDG